jgi:hypothetical protein
MTQGTDFTTLTTAEAERLIAAVQEINATIENLADRLIQVLSNPPTAAPLSD